MEFTMISLQGKIKEKYPDLNGRDWVNRIDPQDKQVLVHAMQAGGQYGRLGGKARAATAQRDAKGRFC